ncbi:MAG TPA: YCF48-related protein [Candidatus Binatia bacterium]|nr:YCF48-related protein [Candidatus Binatia bacterium]
MRFVLSFLAGLILGLVPPVDFSAATSPKEPAFQENFYGVQIQDERAWIVGYYGTILHSRDRGLTWEIQPSPTRNALFRVHFLDGDKGWISGSYGTILHTLDAGKKWSAQPSGTTEHLLGLTSLGSQMWAVGSRGTILHTRDQGRSWLNASLPEDLTFSSVSFVDSTRGWTAGEFGVIFQTHDGGKTWAKQKSPIEVSFASGESRNLFALLFPDRKNGFAFGLDGTILKAPGGSRWEIVRQKETANHSVGANHLFAAAAFNGRLWAVGERGTLLRSELDGLSWRAASAQTPRVSLNGIAFGKDGWGLIVGNRGVILRTGDAGQTWNRLRIIPREQEKGSHLP